MPDLVLVEEFLKLLSVKDRTTKRGHLKILFWNIPHGEFYQVILEEINGMTIKTVGAESRVSYYLFLGSHTEGHTSGGYITTICGMQDEFRIPIQFHKSGPL